MADPVVPIEDNSLDIQDLTNLFNEDLKDETPPEDNKEIEDDKEPPLIDDVEDKEEDEEVEDEKKEKKTKEDEEEIELELDENEDLIDLPRRKDIIKEFPEFFKKFPAVEKAMFREKQYAEIFPTPADAKSAIETVKTFETFRTDLMNGSIEATLSSVKEINPKAFQKIAGDLINTLHRVDKDAWTDVVSELVQSALYKAYTDGEADSTETGKNLKLAAQWVSKHLLGTADIKPAQKREPERPNEAETKLAQQQREYFEREQYRAVNDVTTRVESTLKNAVEKSIDPKDQMTPYVRSKAINDVLGTIRDLIGKDSRFRASLEKQWHETAKDNFSETGKDRIRRAILSKAKTLLPDVIRTVKAEAMKGIASKGRDASESRDEKPIKSGRPASANSSSDSNRSMKKSEIPKGMSNMEFLLKD